MLAGLAVSTIADLSGLSLPYLVGTLVTLLVIWFGPRAFPGATVVLQLSACTLGVYLCHLIALNVTGRLIGHGNYLTACLAFGGALFAVWLAQRLMPITHLIHWRCVSGRAGHLSAKQDGLMVRGLLGPPREAARACAWRRR